MTKRIYEVIVRALCKDTGKTYEQSEFVTGDCFVIGAHGELVIHGSDPNDRTKVRKIITYSAIRWLDISELSQEKVIKVNASLGIGSRVESF